MTRNQTFVTVTIPTLNAASTLRDCLESLRCQACQDFDTIVIDCGSKDNTIDIANEYDVKVISTKGIYLLSQRRIGAIASQADFCLLLDADQVLESTAIERLKNDFYTCDMVILEERSYKPRHILSKLADIDRLIIQRRYQVQTNQLNLGIYPRFYRKRVLTKAFDRIPQKLERSSNNWDDAIIYYEASKLTSRTGYLPYGVYHQDRDSWREFIRHYYNYGRNLRNLELTDEYWEMIHNKMWRRNLLTGSDLSVKERLAWALFLSIKAVPHTLGYWLGQE